MIYTGPGDDLAYGGRGSDLVYAEGGDDTFFFVAAGNIGETDVYDGGTGSDALRLYVDAATWLDPTFQNEMADWLVFSNSSPDVIDSEPFVFTSLGLSITSIEEVSFPRRP